MIQQTILRQPAPLKKKAPCRNMCWAVALLLAAFLAIPLPAEEPQENLFGCLYSKFHLTLDNGQREEFLGPLYYQQRTDSVRTRAAPPIFSYRVDEEIDIAEFDVLYPLLTYDRFGGEYRFQIMQLLSFSGGPTTLETNVSRFTLFPFYFQQRSPIPERNYTAVVPFYGRLKNRLWRDEVHFVMLPLYLRSRKKDVVTDNFLYPFFHLRKGEALQGWQFWPLAGREVKAPTQKTNQWNELEIVGGHRKTFALWPFFLDHHTQLGTTNPVHQLSFLPLFYAERSPQRDLTAAPWPIGFVYTDDREKKFRQWSAPWPLIAFARGEGKTMNRVFPLFSRGRTPVLERNSYLWPLYHYSHLQSAPLDRSRTRILLFLYSNLQERNLETETTRRRVAFWPLFSWNREHLGQSRLQILALLEPILPNNEGIQRNYSPLWSLWRSENNPETGAASQSLLWNLYRRSTSPTTKKYSLLFGLFQYQSTEESSRWRLFYLPFGKRPDSAGP